MFQLLIHNLKKARDVCASHVAKSCVTVVCRSRSLVYVHSAVDAEELACLLVELFQVLSVPVEIWGEEQVRPQVDTVSDKNNV